MGEKKSGLLFNLIAPIYGLFYKKQKRSYVGVVERVKNEMDISSFDTVVDIGCGTGALCSVLNDIGMNVTGIDPAVMMLNVAKNITTNKGIEFIYGNVLKGLIFKDKSFDVSITSYVAHGLVKEERKKMYAEMSRITRDYVIIHDYNKKRSLLTSVVEWVEGGDYFHFIKNAEPEMKECLVEMNTCFSEVRVINVDVRANWYICKPV